MISEKTLGVDELRNILSVVEEVFNYLPDKALRELLGGYENDIENLMRSTMEVSHDIVNCNRNDFQGLNYLDAFSEHFDMSLRRVSYNYFKTTCLPEFNQGWRNIEWGNLMQLYKFLAVIASRTSGKSHEFTFAYPIWKMYRYKSPTWGSPNTRENRLNKEGVIITNEYKLGKKLLEKIVTEINNNDIIAEVLRPKNGAIGKESIKAKNGARVELRSYGSAIRGIHPGWGVVDDFLDVSALYSHEQREKFLEIFKAEIRPAIEPGGDLKVVGTPFTLDDLYSKLKQDPNFLVLEYPAIFPDGRLLAPDRLGFGKLGEEKDSLGTLVFSREYLCQPIADKATIFPYSILNPSKNEHLTYSNDIDSYGVKLDRVVMGCDFAISGNIGADYSVFTVWGVKYGEQSHRYYLIGIWRQQGASHSEQISRIISMNNRFNPNKIRPESNGFQKIMSDMVKERGVKNIEEFTTTSKIKKDLRSGLPSLAALFERGQIVLPYGDEYSREMTDYILSEFNSITFLEDKGKLESSGGHDDTVMSSFFAITDLRENKSEFKVSYI